MSVFAGSRFECRQCDKIVKDDTIIERLRGNLIVVNKAAPKDLWKLTVFDPELKALLTKQQQGVLDTTVYVKLKATPSVGPANLTVLEMEDC